MERLYIIRGGQHRRRARLQQPLFSLCGSQPCIESKSFCRHCAVPRPIFRSRRVSGDNFLEVEAQILSNKEKEDKDGAEEDKEGRMTCHRMLLSQSSIFCTR